MSNKSSNFRFFILSIASLALLIVLCCVTFQHFHMYQELLNKISEKQIYPESNSENDPDSSSDYLYNIARRLKDYKKLKWVNRRESINEDDLVQGGYDANQNPLYVCRALHNVDIILPGAYSLSDEKCFVTLNAKVYGYKNFELLVGQRSNIAWIPSEQVESSMGKVVAGISEQGDELFISRFRYNGSLLVGKMHDRWWKGFGAYGGKELSSEIYELLVIYDVDFEKEEQ